MPTIVPLFNETPIPRLAAVPDGGEFTPVRTPRPFTGAAQWILVTHSVLLKVPPRIRLDLGPGRRRPKVVGATCGRQESTSHHHRICRRPRSWRLTAPKPTSGTQLPELQDFHEVSCLPLRYRTNGDVAMNTSTRVPALQVAHLKAGLRPTPKTNFPPAWCSTTWEL